MSILNTLVLLRFIYLRIEKTKKRCWITVCSKRRRAINVRFLIPLAWSGMSFISRQGWRFVARRAIGCNRGREFHQSSDEGSLNRVLGPSFICEIIRNSFWLMPKKTLVTTALVSAREENKPRFQLYYNRYPYYNGCEK